MSNTNTGGPAFPGFDYIDQHGKKNPEGMTLRDYFAAHADVSIYTPLNNLTDKLNRKPTVGEMAEYIASIRTIEADAMLKARGA